jgi:hypothetical protein
MASSLLIAHHFDFPTMETPLTPEAPGNSMEEPLIPEEPCPMEVPVTPDEPGVTTCTIYIPNFLEEYSLSEQSLEQQKN